MIKKIGAGWNGSKINSARLRTASFLETCAALSKSTEASDVPYGEIDCLFDNERARKAFI